MTAELTLAGCAMMATAGMPAAQDSIPVLPDVLVTASRLGSGIPGTSTSVITADEIARSPDLTLQDILSRQPGIQAQNLFGGVDGARDIIDMRGFGAAATANTLILLNGRRLNDVDLAGVDFTAIPRESIERIEIIRGNSGAVLYGDGAVGGVINIVTKSGIGVSPSFREEFALGTLRYRGGNTSMRGSIGPIAVSVHGAATNSDGYRSNNELRERTFFGELRHAGENGEVYIDLSADRQHLGLPGGRLVTSTSSELTGDPRGTSEPFNYAAKQGLSITGGGTRTLSEGVELVIDGGVRNKDQQAATFSSFGANFDTYIDTTLTTASFTPRLNLEHRIAGKSAKLLTGVDTYWSIYDSDRMLHKGDAPAHHYDLDQRTIGFYAQENVAAWSGTDVSLGVRVENAAVKARDKLDARAPGGSSQVQGLPLDQGETQYAAHLGAEHGLTDNLTVFGRLGRSFRIPNVDERVGQAPFGVPTTFSLRSQTSRDIEGGARVKVDSFELQSSAYVMHLNNEIHFTPVTFTNINLDPTRRYGVENAATYQVSDALLVKGALSYVNAQFRSGRFKGNDVPLVSTWTGNAGVSWNIWKKFITFDADLRYIGSRRFDNDQANFQPLIPANPVVDVRIGGELDRVHWSLVIQNLLDRSYFNYGIASATTLGRFNAYPMPGRVFLGKLAVKF